MSNLADRLRSLYAYTGNASNPPVHTPDVLLDAAQKIELLEAENAALREELAERSAEIAAEALEHADPEQTREALPGLDMANEMAEAGPTNPHPDRSCDQTCDCTDAAHDYGVVFTVTRQPTNTAEA